MGLGVFARMLESADRMLHKFEELLNLAAAISILALMFLATAQVLSRKLLNIPIPGYIDIAEQSIAIFAFFGIAYCQKLGAHVRMEILVAKFKGRTLWMSEALQTLATLALIIALAIFSYKHFGRAWEHGDSTIDIQLPTWPSKLAVSICLMVLAVRLAIQLIGFTRLVLSPAGDPVAVPVVMDVESMARMESESAPVEPAKRKRR